MKMIAIPCLVLFLSAMLPAPTWANPPLSVAGQERRPQQGGSQSKRDQHDPTKNNPDVPRQEPGTDNPDVGKQRHPPPGGTGDKQESTSTRQAKKKPKPRKDTSAEAPKN